MRILTPVEARGARFQEEPWGSCWAVQGSGGRHPEVLAKGLSLLDWCPCALGLSRDCPGICLASFSLHLVFVSLAEPETAGSSISVLEPAPQGLGAPKAKTETLFYTQTASPFGNALSVSRTFGPRAISANGFAVWKRFVSLSDIRSSSNISKRLRHFSYLRSSNRHQTRNGNFGSSTRNLWTKPWKSLKNQCLVIGNRARSTPKRRGTPPNPILNR